MKRFTMRTFHGALISVGLLLTSLPAAADPRPTVWDLGVLALATHDLRAQAGERDLANVEDSRLNLSTLYESTDGRGIEVLGHRKNTFNTITTSVCRYFADYHFATVASLELDQPQGSPAELTAIARGRTVQHFIHCLAGSFERITGLPFPTTPLDGELDASETVALLLGHDLLPGTISALDRNGRPVDRDRDGAPDHYNVADRTLDEYVLGESEMLQPVKGFDGRYDPAFLAFKRKGDGAVLNLKEVDRMVIGFLDPTFDLERTLDAIAARSSIRGTDIAARYLSTMAKGISPIRKGTPVPYVPENLDFLRSKAQPFRLVAAEPGRMGKLDAN